MAINKTTICLVCSYNFPYKYLCNGECLKCSGFEPENFQDDLKDIYKEIECFENKKKKPSAQLNHIHNIFNDIFKSHFTGVK